MQVPGPLSPWAARGRTLEVGPERRRVFVVEQGPRDAPAIGILHGFPTFSVDFERVLDALSERHRVIVHDHLGFGVSAKPSDYSYSLFEQAELAVMLWQQLGVERLHVIAHDYGTSVATELVARRERGLLPIALRSLTLSNGSVHLELAKLTWPQLALRSPRVGPVFARLANQPLFRARLRKTLAQRDALSDDDLTILWEGVSHAGGRAALAPISRYLDERVRFAPRWIGALTRFDAPAHVLWGREDPIAVPAIAEQLAREIPGAELSWLEGVGHYPMVEAPEAWATAALAFLERIG